MKRGRSTGNPTRAEAVWLRTVKHAGCVCCAAHGYYREEGGPLAEAHHLLLGGIRRGHHHTVGLCPWHHRGALIVTGWTHASHRRLLGPSLAEGSVPFHEAFGDDGALMAATHALIARQSSRAA
jgi:hypothetical protein